MRRALALLAFLGAVPACSDGSVDAPGSVTPSEKKALDDAAAMIASRPRPADDAATAAPGETPPPAP